MDADGGAEKFSKMNTNSNPSDLLAEMTLKIKLNVKQKQEPAAAASTAASSAATGGADDTASAANAADVYRKAKKRNVNTIATVLLPKERVVKLKKAVEAKSSGESVVRPRPYD